MGGDRHRHFGIDPVLVKFYDAALKKIAGANLKWGERCQSTTICRSGSRHWGFWGIGRWLGRIQTSDQLSQHVGFRALGLLTVGFKDFPLFGGGLERDPALIFSRHQRNIPI